MWTGFESQCGTNQYLTIMETLLKEKYNNLKSEKTMDIVLTLQLSEYARDILKDKLIEISNISGLDYEYLVESITPL